MRPRALITGASMGIGAEIARALAARGYDLVLVARSRGKLEALAEELSKSNATDAWVVDADLADSTAPRRIHDAVVSRGGTVDLLVNNAGFGAHGPFHELPIERELEMIQVNISALVSLTGLFLPRMVERKKGHVLNLASTAGFQPGPYIATYYATKAFVLSFSEALSVELHGSGVSVTCSCPGPVRTAFLDTAGNGDLFFFDVLAVDPRGVAEHAVRSTLDRRVIAVPGFSNKLGVVLAQLAPRWAVRWVVAWLNSFRTRPRAA
ncbi:MAG: SDR family oxidoreductase [Deltaproteobacteria bacterium]|nr:SDR family oxidoreductase [Deltaproteobacteria bacterium]